MDPSRLSRSDNLSLSRGTSSSYFPPYKSEEEEHEHEEDVGLLSATSTRLQHIASRRLLLFGNNKSRKPQPWPRTHNLRSRSSGWRTKLLLFPFSATLPVLLFFGAFVIGGLIGYYARGGSHAQAQDVVESCRSMSTAEKGGEKALKLLLAGELNGLVPAFEVKPVVFGKELLAANTSSHSSPNNTIEDEEDEDWKSYMPAGNGFIAVDNPSQYRTLPPSIDFQDQTVYSISVFHQIHCLHTIMQAYNSLSDSTPSKTPAHNHVSHPPSQQRDGHHQHPEPQPKSKLRHIHSKNHINHCFRYLRQSLVCCGDTALEGQDLHHPELKATNGEGAVHLCRDFGALKGWAEGRRVV